MAESHSSCKSTTETQKALTDMDMVAVQQLMQLSDEDNNNNSSKKKNTRRIDNDHDDEEVDQEKTSIEVSCRSKKQRRYRSLVNIYMETRPMNAAAGRYEKTVRV
ncbi:hypothetical protein O6P43_030382 [Quillaja saponaria]|uniref:Uncharacterized protein n=1 Tax=Quillaja saponaria TaxID=32244 RepID=A0AAD7KUB3_QUISA|nr:hypothetical protein O6P43_030382 [Quillaja saponaria]